MAFRAARGGGSGAGVNKFLPGKDRFSRVWCFQVALAAFNRPLRAKEMWRGS
jgi:hypothetical protein